MDGLALKSTKTGTPRVVSLPPSVLALLDVHRQQQNEFRRQFGPDYRADLDLIFVHPDGTRLKPNSISAAVSALFRRLRISKPQDAALHLLRRAHTSVLLAQGHRWRRYLPAEGTHRRGLHKRPTPT
jgi:integrase